MTREHIPEESWVVEKKNKLFPSYECGYWQMGNNYCHHKDNKGECTRENCPLAID